eukprot:jgi/Chrpa1/26106/Chrysochromulina_OHIO_Genome00012052-RA
MSSPQIEFFVRIWPSSTATPRERMYRKPEGASSPGESTMGASESVSLTRNSDSITGLARNHTLRSHLALTSSTTSDWSMGDMSVSSLLASVDS